MMSINGKKEDVFIEKYSQSLIEGKVLPQEFIENIQNLFKSKMEEDFLVPKLSDLSQFYKIGAPRLYNYGVLFYYDEKIKKYNVEFVYSMEELFPNKKKISFKNFSLQEGKRDKRFFQLIQRVLEIKISELYEKRILPYDLDFMKNLEFNDYEGLLKKADHEHINQFMRWIDIDLWELSKEEGDFRLKFSRNLLDDFFIRMKELSQEYPEFDEVREGLIKYLNKMGIL